MEEVFAAEVLIVSREVLRRAFRQWEEDVRNDPDAFNTWEQDRASDLDDHASVSVATLMDYICKAAQ